MNGHPATSSRFIAATCCGSTDDMAHGSITATTGRSSSSQGTTITNESILSRPLLGLYSCCLSACTHRCLIETCTFLEPWLRLRSLATSNTNWASGATRTGCCLPCPSARAFSHCNCPAVEHRLSTRALNGLLRHGRFGTTRGCS